MHPDTEQFRGEMEGLLERLYKLPLPEGTGGQSGVKEEPLPTCEQQRLAGVFDLVLDFWKLKDPKTAEGVGVTFGLVDALCSVKPEQSIFLNVCCRDSSQVQFELKRLPSRVKVNALASGWCPFPPPGHWCLTLGKKSNEPPTSNS